MSPQDTVERVLKDIHVMFSKCESYEGRPDQVIVDRKRFLELLDRLNRGIFDMMEAYEHTRESRTRAELAFQHKGQEMIDDASQKADDVYAASVIYTANMLGQVQALIDEANESMNDVFRSFKRELRNQKEIVKSNEMELESQLHDMADARVYQSMLEDIRRDQRKQDTKERSEREGRRSDRTKPYGKGRIYTPAVSADIKINEAYFEKTGISAEDAKSGYVPSPAPLTAEKPEVKVNLNAEYFKRKAALEAEAKAAKEAAEKEAETAEETEPVKAAEDVLETEAGIAIDPEETAAKRAEEELEDALEKSLGNEVEELMEIREEERQEERRKEERRETAYEPAAERGTGRREVPAWKERMKVLFNEIAPKDINEK